MYADDICLFAGSKSGLEKLYNVVMEFANKYNDLVMNPSKSFILRMGYKKQPVSTFDNIPTTDATRYLGAQIAKFQKLQDREEDSRCCRQIYTATNLILSHYKHIKYLDSSAKNALISAFGVPYGIELRPEVSSKMRRAHRFMTKKFYPRSFFIKDANNYDISSTMLYGEIAQCQSLTERGRVMRDKYLNNAKNSGNLLIRSLIGCYWDSECGFSDVT